MKSEREEFEAWYAAKHYQGDKESAAAWLVREEGRYLYEHPGSHWAAWQAARQQAVPSDTALRRAGLFLDSLDSGCKEVQTLRRLLAAAPKAEPSKVGTICRIESWEGSSWVMSDHEYRIDYVGASVVVATTVNTPRAVERVFKGAKLHPTRIAIEPQAEQAVEPWIVRVYNMGYHNGHHHTVEGTYTDVHHNDMDSYHEDVVQEILEDMDYLKRTAPPAPDVSGLVEALESIVNEAREMGIPWAVWTAERALAAHKQEGK